MENILILDIGNSKTKCYVFDADIQLLHEEQKPTNRGHPWDLVDTIKNMLNRAIDVHSPRHAMVTAFGDAFIHYSPAVNGRPRFVFADESAEMLPPYAYSRMGFPDGNIQITGVRRLKAKHQASWTAILPPNIFIAAEVGGNTNWKKWDIIMAACSGLYDLRTMKWIDDEAQQIGVCAPYNEVGMYRNMSIRAGGMDNGFVNNFDDTPYIVAGTWLVLSVPHETFQPTPEREKAGVRWLYCGNRYHNAQTVRKVSNPINRTEVERIIDDLKVAGATLGTKVRVFGGYAKELTHHLHETSSEFEFYTPENPSLYQHQQSAIYLKRSLEKNAR